MPVFSTENCIGNNPRRQSALQSLMRYRIIPALQCEKGKCRETEPNANIQQSYIMRRNGATANKDTSPFRLRHVVRAEFARPRVTIDRTCRCECSRVANPFTEGCLMHHCSANLQFHFYCFCIQTNLQAVTQFQRRYCYVGKEFVCLKLLTYIYITLCGRRLCNH